MQKILCVILLALTCAVTGHAGPPVRFAVIGDYGWTGQPEADVAALVKSWNPGFIITVGDNNYDDGAASTIDRNIGQYFHEFIFPYAGGFGPGSRANRFFPALGNHDWNARGALPYLNYFTLPGNERYYDFVSGPVHFYVIDSDDHEPDGNSSTSPQARWLHDRLAASEEPWKLVYFHHPPFSSGARHGGSPVMRWPFREWGASAVLAGHEHLYERLSEDGIPYFVNGSGGRSLYEFGNPVAGSQVRYNADYGAMLVNAHKNKITFEFITRTGRLVDSFTLHRRGMSAEHRRAAPESLPVLHSYPNPFNPTTRVSFSVGGPQGRSFVSLKIYNLLGEVVSDLVEEEKEPGQYSVNWDAGHLPSGMYICRLTTGAVSRSDRLVLVR